MVARGRVVDRFTEVELELIAGPPSTLEPLARVLGQIEGLRPASGSKLDAALSSAAAAAATPDRVDEEHKIGGVDEVDGIDGIAEVSEGGTSTGEPATATPAIVLVDEMAMRAYTDPETPPIVAPVPVEVATDPIPSAPRPKSPGVTADDTLAEAGRKVLRFHFERMLAREAGTRAGADPEELHAMRVATRRMRAAWRIFGDAYRPERTKRFRTTTRDVGRRLGAVRDLDVLLDGLEGYRAAHPSEATGLDPLASAWRLRREEGRVLLIRELDSARYARFVDEFGEFAGTEGTAVAEVTATSPHRIRDTAPARIWAAHGDVRAYEAVLRWADVETLHELRIAGKWLRYSLEFVREALGPGVEPLIVRVVALQDHLGMMNDAHVSAGMARAYLVEHGTRLSSHEGAAIGRYLVDEEREAARLRRAAARPFKVVAGPAFRHALARLVSEL